MGQAFYIKHMPPTEGFLLHVGKQALYTLSSDAPPGKELPIPRQGDLKIVVKAARLDGGKGQIVLGAAGLLPQGIVVRQASLFPVVNEATFTVTAAPRAAADAGFNLGDALLAYATLALVATGNDVIASILGNMAAGIECEHDGNWPVTPDLVLKKIDAVEKVARYQ